MKAKDFLGMLRATPQMFASNKEAFVAQVVTSLIMEDIGIGFGEFYAKHLNQYGSMLLSCDDPFDDEWAHVVVDEALAFIKE